jgi:hypothetical protein
MKRQMDAVGQDEDPSRSCILQVSASSDVFLFSISVAQATKELKVTFSPSTILALWIGQWSIFILSLFCEDLFISAAGP